MVQVINYLIYFPSFISHCLFFLFFIQRIIITKSSFSSLFPQQQQFSLYTRHDIIDKNVKSVETFLSPQDLANMPEREVDLRESYPW
ncbi:Astacin domain-containing protein [Meloidogyne graminicola]|uniref:Astacin domain-containing protein n=1 Tax=Meloidogyne graminicola TaxID=189291 RepID=A0A8S9ZTU1_9BILA|nr:Astacin domain-containing protein [Meloidogyne graminicola]